MTQAKSPLRAAVLLVTAISFAPSYAHVLEAYPRLVKFQPELWREATVFQGQYQLFGIIGGPVDIAAVCLTAVWAYLTRSDRHSFRLALAGAILFALGLAAWLTIVAPANGALAHWAPGPLPPDFTQIRTRWELGHMVVAGLKLIGLICVNLAVLRFKPASR